MLYVLLALVGGVNAFHCGYDVGLAGGQTSLKFTIDTKPALNTKRVYWRTDVGDKSVYSNYQPRSPRNNKVLYWPSNLDFFFFGKLKSKAATISAKFVNPEDDSLVYGVVIDCGAGTWKTSYRNPSLTTDQTLLTGTLNTPCTVGPFDLSYELQQQARGKFIFNGQALVNGMYGKMIVDQRTRKSYWTGFYRIGKIPTDLSKGTVVKVDVTGALVERYAYGKCFAFPEYLKRNCTEANKWVQSRSKIKSLDWPSEEEPKTRTGDELPKTPYLNELGMNQFVNNVKCSKEFPTYFHNVQDSVHADENSDTYQYCCCCYMNGTLASCYTYGELGGACPITCLDYSYVRTSYPGLEALYNPNASDAEVKASVAEVQSTMEEKEKVVEVERSLWNVE